MPVCQRLAGITGLTVDGNAYMVVSDVIWSANKIRRELMRIFSVPFNQPRNFNTLWCGSCDAARRLVRTTRFLLFSSSRKYSVRT